MILKKKKLYFVLGILLTLTLILSACSNTIEPAIEDNIDESLAQHEDIEDPEEGLQILTTISIIGDLVENVIGDRGQVEYLVPIGEEPEEYEPIPSDFQKISDTDVVFANGLNLEGWIERVMTNVSGTDLVYVTEGAPTITLIDQDIDDPHLWLNVSYVIDYYLDNILNTVISLDPQGEGTYRENTEQYIKELRELELWIEESVKEIPEENRLIVISENALKYFGEAYGFETEGIWELNSHEEGTPQQISRVIDLVRERNIPSIFVETTVSDRYMQMVSSESRVPIAGSLYTDAIGVKGSPGDTYIKMMRHNVEVLVEGLRGR
ncbi:periplasmic solute binding protein [Alkaliphilus metalliredigens QYMF]|uniref:Periplasmic solute binding protein n=1 Tax=Alkaliphilus metalliredigens (strain QYMF) TaxID=293826 RepID=A6TNQ5_ALKMQ|nr:zinc ABC transporter substrate-binding protein [Alkaliphilus metalliredigens]ABR47823.1 periplasmic solute binding protein [Alkaliphilus metalliredigens QYMF]